MDVGKEMILGWVYGWKLQREKTMK